MTPRLNIHDMTFKGIAKQATISWIWRWRRSAVLQIGVPQWMAPYLFSISVVRSIGRASTVCPRPVTVVARKREL